MNKFFMKIGRGLLFLLVLTSNTISCSDSGNEDGMVSLADMDLVYSNISIVRGATSGNTSLPGWSVTHSEIDYSISPSQAGVSVDTNGIVSVATDTVLASAVYTVTAMAKATSGKYTGSQTTTLTIEIIYAIGDTGPARGKVFYGKGSYSDGRRFLEAAPSVHPNEVEWGGYGTEVGTATAIGTGEANTKEIVKVLGNGNYTTSGNNMELNDNYAAKTCDNLKLDDYDDWFLPSKDELNELSKLYESYEDKDPNDSFVASFNESDPYWSSSENNSPFSYYGWAQNSSGFQDGLSKDEDSRVRTVRAF